MSECASECECGQQVLWPNLVLAGNGVPAGLFFSTFSFSSPSDLVALLHTTLNLGLLCHSTSDPFIVHIIFHSTLDPITWHRSALAALSHFAPPNQPLSFLVTFSTSSTLVFFSHSSTMELPCVHAPLSLKLCCCGRRFSFSQVLGAWVHWQS